MHSLSSEALSMILRQLMIFVHSKLLVNYPIEGYFCKVLLLLLFKITIIFVVYTKYNHLKN